MNQMSKFEWPAGSMVEPAGDEAAELGSVVTPLDLRYRHQCIESLVVMPNTTPEPCFELTPVERPQAAIASVVLAFGLLRVELHDAEQLVLDTNLAVEQQLPPVVLAARVGAKVEPLRLLGRDWGERLRRPLWVRRGGTAEQPIITIGGAARGTWTLEEHECRLWWTSGARACTLRMSVDRTGTQVILRPGCCEP